VTKRQLIISAALYFIFVMVVMSLMSCTTSHVYVSNGNEGRAGPKALLDADVKMDLKSEINAIKKDAK